MCNVCGSMGILLSFISMSCILLSSNLLHASTRERCARWVVCSLVRARAVLLPCCALPVGRSRSRHDGSHRRANVGISCKLPNFSGAERGRHDRIKTVSRSYQHINYTVSTTYQQCINLMADSPLAAARRTCVSQRAESVHACAICDLATYKPPTVGQEAERAHCKRCWDCTRLCRQRNGHSACGNCMGARGRRPRLQLHDRQLNR